MENLVQLGLHFYQLELYFHALVAARLFHFPGHYGLFQRADACEQSGANQYLHSLHLKAMFLVLFLEPLLVGPALFLHGLHLEHNGSGVNSGHFQVIMHSKQ